MPSPILSSQIYLAVHELARAPTRQLTYSRTHSLTRVLGHSSCFLGHSLINVHNIHEEEKWRHEALARPRTLSRAVTL
eukprot:4795611-Pleurochrysis_carterae.AAC.1